MSVQSGGWSDITFQPDVLVLGQAGIYTQDSRCEKSSSLKGLGYMWLQTDERRLLASYYRMLGGRGQKQFYGVDALVRLLDHPSTAKTIQPYGKSGGAENSDSNRRNQQRQTELHERLRRASNLLSGRELIVLHLHRDDPSIVGIQLTEEGSQLGASYAWWFTRAELFIQEFKVHWIWIVLVAIGTWIITQQW